MPFRFPQALRRPIAILSTMFITGAIILELANLVTTWVYDSPIQGLSIVFIVGRIALIGHAIEAAISAVFATSRGRSPLSFGIYTFFVGTIGLFELFELFEPSPTTPNP